MSKKNNSTRGGWNIEKIKDITIVTLASVVFVLLAMVIAFYINPQGEPASTHLAAELKEEETCERKIQQLRYWSVAVYKFHEMGTRISRTRTMDRVFERFQYEFVNASHGDDWDVLWSIDYPFLPGMNEKDRAFFANFDPSKLRREQKVNHFPGMLEMVSKSDMNDINAHLPYILPSFVMPFDADRFNELTAKNPEVQFVEKNWFNGGVRIISRSEVDMESKDKFYQQFMDDPLLIDGRTFDMGVFVLITSFDPIRVYRYNGDVLFRFCTKEYHPFDQNDLGRYVVRPGFTNAYELPSFEKIYNQYGFSFKNIFNKLMRERGHDIEDVWRRIDDAIAKIVINSEEYVREDIQTWNTSSHHYFEFVRFDFIFDNKLNPYVMEVNMSPTVTPYGDKYEENCNIYEPMIYNTLQMVGGASYHDFTARFNDSDIIVANHKNIAMNLETCLKNDCHSNCTLYRCKVCLPCVDAESRYQMREAFREQSYSNNFKRVFPTKVHYDDQKLIKSLSSKNRISVEWFKSQCEIDDKWC